MKKLVTALIVVLPLILLIAIFAVTNIAKIAANVRATGITISNKGDDGVFTFDIYANRTPIEEWELGVQVLPLIASDLRYELSVTDAESGEASDIVTLREDGYFELNDIGVAKLTYTSVDGGYTDSVLFNIISSGALDFTPVISDVTGKRYPLEEGVGTDYALTLTSGAYKIENDFYPAGMTASDVLFGSSDESVASVDPVSGKLDAIFSGNAIITVRVAGVLPKTIALTVNMADSVTVDGIGASSHPELSRAAGLSRFNMAVETRDKMRADEIGLTGENILSATAAPTDADISPDEAYDRFILSVELSDIPKDNTSYIYTLNAGGSAYEITVTFSDHSFVIYSSINTSNSNELLMFNGETTRFSIVAEPSDPDLKYEWELSEDTFARIVSSYGNVVELKALAMGETTLTVRWQIEGEDGIAAEGVIERTLKIINGVSSLLFEEKAKDWGLGEQAIASMRFEKGAPVKAIYSANFRSYGRGDAAPLEDFVFTSSDASLARVYTDGSGVNIEILGTGSVKVTAQWIYGERFNVAPASFSFTAVDGVYAGNYEELKAAMANKLTTVLSRDIYLGENLFDVADNGERTPKYDTEVARAKLLEETSEIETTWDWTYYKNMGAGKPTVRYCLEFTADVYGNGNSISAEYITNMLFNPPTLYQFAVFTGPLDFVATNITSPKTAAVKGQDNIVFLNRTDGLTLNNVVLMGCDTESLYDMDDEGKIDLVYLNSVGTTLEVMADTTIVNSRIMNGRTLVRAFGRYGVEEGSEVNAEAERIEVLIDNCKLQNAREFLLKVGTNRYIKGDENEPSPSLPSASGKYVAQNEPNSKATDEERLADEYFTENYILTDITVKDSTLSSSGLFTIGMESHFSGDMLAGADMLKFDGWTGLAGTSYPAALRLVGDVILDDWKDIEYVDSSTLIETEGSSDGTSFLSLNIDAMLKHVKNRGLEGYDDIIAERGGRNYVHGGIAFYGGGKNYSVLDLSKYTAETLKQYKINLSVLADNKEDVALQLQGQFLPKAAGYNDFRFFMLPASSYKG